MVLGDLNLDRIGDPLYEAFISTGLWPPIDLNALPGTIFDDDKTNHFYDQVAWFSKPDGTSLLKGLAYGLRAGSFDLIPHVFRGLSRTPSSSESAGHPQLPLFLRLRQPLLIAEEALFRLKERQIYYGPAHFVGSSFPQGQYLGVQTVVKAAVPEAGAPLAPLHI